MSLKFIFNFLAYSIFLIGLIYAIYTYYRIRFSRMQARVNKRLAAIGGTPLNKSFPTSVVGQFSSSIWLSSRLKKWRLSHWLNSSFLKLKWNVQVDQFLLLNSILFIFTALLISYLGGSFLLWFSIALIAGSVPLIYLKIVLDRRQQKLEIQLPEILNFISRAMQAGHTFIGSMQMAAAESQEPIASEFQKTFQEISFGRTVQEAMADLSKRIDCSEMRYFAVAVFINQEIGGNLASLINGVATLIRERIKSKMILHAMTSEARTSAWILSSLPFVVASVMAVIRPDFIQTLWVDPGGRAMMGYALVLMFFGIIWMQRMAKIRV